MAGRCARAWMSLGSGRWRRWRRRWSRRSSVGLALGLVLSLTAGLLHAPALAAPSSDEPSRKSVPVGSVTPKAPKKSPTDGPGVTSVTRKTLPGAASATVPVSGAAVKVGDLPMAFSPAAPPQEDDLRAGQTPPPGPTSVRVQVWDQGLAKAAGVTGAMLTLSRADGVGVSGRVKVRVDYWQFANAFGGDYAGRLRLVELPACALNTPGESTCRRGTDLGAINAAGALTTDVTVGATDAATVLAVTSSASSAGGTYETTSLRQAYSWAAGQTGGGFTSSYPLSVPPAAGPAPSLALTYDSALVDGQTITSNGQGSWVGEGWDLQVGYIERSYRPCKQDGETTLPDDLCWFSSDNATMVFAGQSTPLVRDSVKGWRSAKDDGLKIEKLNDATSGNGDNDGEYWKVTTPDGTQYFFGKNKRYPNDNETTNSVQTVPVYGNNPGEPCAGGRCWQAYRWNLDYVVDPRNNSMTYVYNKLQGFYAAGSGGNTQYDLAANLDHIDYGDRAETEHSGNAPMRVEFTREPRCVNSCTDEDYLDTPMEMYCRTETSTCASNGPVFFNTFKLTAVTTFVWDNGSPAQYRRVDRWELGHTFPPNPDLIAPAGPDTPPNLWLQSVKHIGYARDGSSLAEPLMQFGGTPLDNRVDWGNDVGVPPYTHYRLTSVNTGTGAETSITYTRTPDTGAECERAWVPIPDNNPHLCFPQRELRGGFSWFYKYLVSIVQENDLTGGSPSETIFYDYSNEASSDSAMWAHDLNETVWLESRTWSQWRGFSTVTASKNAEDGSGTVSRNVYHRGMDGDGKTTGDGLGVAWDSRRVGLLAPIGTPGLDAAISGQDGKCLDIVNGSKVEGTSVHLWTCYGGWSQVWQPGPNGSIRNPESGMCLDIDGWGTANGTEVQIWGCTGDWNQVWQPQPNGSLKNPQSGKCLDISSWGTVDGTRVQLWDCTNDWNQVWQPQPSRALMNPQANRCIDMADAGGNNGTAVQSYGCTNGINQIWQLQPNGNLVNVLTGKCIDIDGLGTANGTKIQVWDCTNGWNQVWQPQPDGSLKNPQSGKCLEAGGNAAGQLVLWDCNGSLSQKWINRFKDTEGLHGFLRESQDLNGTQIAAATIHLPTVIRTATRAAPAPDGQEMHAHRVLETTTKARTWIAAGSRWRWTEAQASYDTQYGLPTEMRDLGDVTVPSDDTCTRISYAQNHTAHMVGYPAEVIEYAGACGSVTVLSHSQSFYDNSTTVGAAPSLGLKTKSRLLTAVSDVWAVTEAAYDSRGRPKENKDARGQITTTSYTPPDDLPLREATVTNPKGHRAFVSFEEGRGQPTKVLDANGRATITEYDALGRRTAVWLPSEKQVNGDPASMRYEYDINTTEPHRLTRQVLQTASVEPGSPPVYLTTFEFLDGRFRTRNTQAPAPGGGRIVTETRYDARGQVAAVTAPFYNEAIAGSAMTNTAGANVPSQTVYSYDNLGRVTIEALQADGVEKWHTQHSYDGDRHTVQPPSGGPVTTMYDAANRPVTLSVYPTGPAETTTYQYDTAGNLTSIKDAAGNETRYGYNLAGLRTSIQDPDTGASSFVYNPAGDLLSTTDARGQKISYEYDTLGRPTFRWAGEIGTGTKLTSHEYDLKTAATGHLSKTIRHTTGGDYIVEPVGYDDRYRPTGIRWTIPASEGVLAGSYTTDYGYDSADHLTSITYPARAGLPTETVGISYDDLGYPTTLAGRDNYITATTFTGIGQIESRTYGNPGPGELIRNYSWEAATGRLAGISATLPDPAVPGTRRTVQDDRYGHHPVGDVASIKDHTDGQSQCYHYDNLHRLKEAWTALDDCAANPTDAAVPSSGKHPYWDSFTFDTAGRRATDKHRTATDTTDRTYTYPAAGQPHPHAATSITVTGGGNRTDTFGYDLAGNMKTRTVADVTSNYTLNLEGRFNTATVNTGGGQEQTSHLYDADGALLIRTDPTGKTLYLGGEELKATGSTVTGTRYYSHDGAVVAARTEDGLAWLAADHQASANLTVDPGTGDVQRRWYTPYGTDRAQVSDWPTDRGFLNAPTNTSTKLIDLGARQYDPDTGTFIAPDPLIDLGNPNSFNPYAYAHHNPITLSDPTGLTPSNDDEFFGTGISNDTVRAHVLVATLTVAAVGVCAASLGVGCAIMASAAITAGVSGTFAEDGQRLNAAAIGAASGAVAGAAAVGAGVLGVSAGLAVTSYRLAFIAGSAAGVSENATSQYLSTGKVDWRQTIQAGALGGIFGVAGLGVAKLGSKLASRIRASRPNCHSFALTTPVLMADGTTKPIEDVQIGDQVTATDPETGQTDPKPVEQLHNNHDSDLTDLTVTIQDTTPGDGANHDTATVLHTTQHHPFWDQTLGEWVDAAELTIGHQLRTTDGDTATVTAVHNHTGNQNMRDLTVADIHTYYVIAGDEPVLVHNCGGARAVDMFGNKIENPDPIASRLVDHTNTALGEWDSGALGYSLKDKVRVALKPSRADTIKGSILDTRVKELAGADSALSELFSTPNGFPGPDWVNTGRSVPGVGWYDLTTTSKWGQHVFDYAPRYGPGVGILWK